MKKTFLVLAGLVGMAGMACAQTVTLRMDAGFLRSGTTATSAVVSNGMLLQLIASPSGVFSNPTSSSYITGDNVLLANLVMNSNSGQAGETLNNVTLTLSTFNLTVGESVILRFFPTLSGTSVPATPGGNTAFGQVRSSTIESGITDASQAPWVIPASGQTVDLLYITAAAQGSTTGTYPDGANGTGISSFASFSTAVPEPSTYVTFACGLVGLVGLQHWNRRKKEFRPTV